MKVKMFILSLAVVSPLLLSASKVDASPRHNTAVVDTNAYYVEKFHCKLATEQLKNTLLHRKQVILEQEKEKQLAEEKIKAEQAEQAKEKQDKEKQDKEKYEAAKKAKAKDTSYSAKSSSNVSSGNTGSSSSSNSSSSGNGSSHTSRTMKITFYDPVTLGASSMPGGMYSGVAANLSVFPKGTVLRITLPGGQVITRTVNDTGGFANMAGGSNQLDIAWQQRDIPSYGTGMAQVQVIG